MANQEILVDLGSGNTNADNEENGNNDWIRRINAPPSETVINLEEPEDEADAEFLIEEQEAKSRIPRKVPSSKADEPKKPKAKLDFKRLLALALPEKWIMLVGLVCLLIANVLLLTIPYYVGKIIDETNIGGTDPNKDAKKELGLSVITLAAFISIASFFATVRAYMFTIAGERIVTRMRQNLFASIMKQEVAFFDETKTGELVNRLASDCTVLQNTVTVNLSMSLRSFISFFVGIVALFVISWRLCFVILASIPFIVVGAWVYGRFVKKLSKAFQEGLAKAAETATEAISLVRTVRSFSNEEFEMDTYSNKVQHAYQLAKVRAKGFGFFTGGVMFLGNISLCGVLYYGGYLVMTGKMSTGGLTSFVIYALNVATSLGTITSLYGDFMNAIGASERVFELIDRVPQVKWKGGVVPPKSAGNLTIEDVHFHYPSREDVPVLKGLNLTLSPGKIIALVGPSGGGKSTIVSLLEAFYYPTKGHIKLDGTDIKDIDPQFLRKHIGIVSQEPQLFGTTVLKNIAYGYQDASFERVVEAAKMANAHQFISAFPEGYDTVVGERGLRLSGGQKQRVAIARALLLDPKILLLDEATSALDAESEHLVQQALDTLMKGRTVLVIAHRLSTVKNADQVCVVFDGRITEQGTHDELIAKPRGLYAKLVKRQLQQK